MPERPFTNRATSLSQDEDFKLTIVSLFLFFAFLQPWELNRQPTALILGKTQFLLFSFIQPQGRRQENGVILKH